MVVELLEILQNKPLAAYKDSSNNLGLNSYFFSEPAPSEKAKVRSVNRFAYVCLSGDLPD